MQSPPEPRNARLTTPLEGTPAAPWVDGAPIAAPLALISPFVKPEWVDYNGHMSESCYLLVFGDQSDAFFRMIGIDEAYRARGYSLYTVQTMICNVQEASEGEALALHLHLVDANDKRLHLFHSMFNAASGDLLATCEQMLVHVDMAHSRSCAMPADLAQRVQAIVAAHAKLPRPKQVGTHIGIRRTN
jgi:acyl-CoA thioester hydrolase